MEELIHLFSPENYRWRLNCLMKCIIFVQDVSKSTRSADILSNPVYSFLFKEKELESCKQILSGSFAEGISLFQNDYFASDYHYGNARLSRKVDIDIMYEINETPAFSELMGIPPDLYKPGLLTTTVERHQLYVTLSEQIDVSGLSDYPSTFAATIKASSVLVQAFASLHPLVENVKNCHCSTEEGFNRYGDVCWSCKDASRIILNDKEMMSTAYVDQVRCIGPCINFAYYIEAERDQCSRSNSSFLSAEGISVLYVDHVPAVKCEGWPINASHFITRKRSSGWPSQKLIDSIARNGYHIVPKSSREYDTWFKLNMHDLFNSLVEWRLSFSVPERQLIDSLHCSQVRCFLFFQSIVKSVEHSFVLRTYHLKTVMLWTCECIPQDQWTDDTLDSCLRELLDRLNQSLEERSLPHYFTGSNLFADLPKDDEESVLKLRETLKVN